MARKLPARTKTPPERFEARKARWGEPSTGGVVFEAKFMLHWSSSRETAADALRGFKPTRFSVHVNGPWCIAFEFEDGDAYRIDFEQYH